MQKPNIELIHPGERILQENRKRKSKKQIILDRLLVPQFLLIRKNMSSFYEKLISKKRKCCKQASNIGKILKKINFIFFFPLKGKVSTKRIITKEQNFQKRLDRIGQNISLLTTVNQKSLIVNTERNLERLAPSLLMLWMQLLNK